MGRFTNICKARSLLMSQKMEEKNEGGGGVSSLILPNREKTLMIQGGSVVMTPYPQFWPINREGEETFFSYDMYKIQYKILKYGYPSREPRDG